MQGPIASVHGSILRSRPNTIRGATDSGQAGPLFGKMGKDAIAI